MKKLIALMATMLIALTAHAAQFKEGENYTTLDLPATTSPTVNEFFSFYCPHCNKFEPIIQTLKESLPENATFQKSHVSFMGGKMGKPMSKAYATMVVLKAEDKMVPAMFNRIHQLKAAPKDEAELRQIFIDESIDKTKIDEDKIDEAKAIYAAKFDNAYKSFAVDSMQRRFDKQFKDAELRGVPSIIVNGKYLVKTESIKSTQNLIDLVNYLLKQK